MEKCEGHVDDPNYETQGADYSHRSQIFVLSLIQLGLVLVIVNCIEFQIKPNVEMIARDQIKPDQHPQQNVRHAHRHVRIVLTQGVRNEIQTAYYDTVRCHYEEEAFDVVLVDQRDEPAGTGIRGQEKTKQADSNLGDHRSPLATPTQENVLNRVDTEVLRVMLHRFVHFVITFHHVAHTQLRVAPGSAWDFCPSCRRR